MAKAISKKSPPTNQIDSVQFDLFRQFVTNNENDVSNTVEVWESIPKYFFTPHQMKKLRTDTGHADPYKWSYRYNDTEYMVKVQPALIEQTNGGYLAFFPSTTEELVEEALKKIFTDQQGGFHDVKKIESWVRFTLKMIQKELKEKGRSRDIKQIKQAIEVMSSSVLTLYKDGKEIWKGSILQDLVTVGRDEYEADRNAHHIARLPLFVSHSINTLEYRQFNYKRLMSCNEQLTRWIYKRLINRYLQASPLSNYHFMYSALKQSGFLQQSTERDNRKKVISALDELKKQGVLLSYEVVETKEGRKITDVKYTVITTPQFTTEQKASNKRIKDDKLKLSTK